MRKEKYRICEICAHTRLSLFIHVIEGKWVLSLFFHPNADWPIFHLGSIYAALRSTCYCVVIATWLNLKGIFLFSRKPLLHSGMSRQSPVERGIFIIHPLSLINFKCVLMACGIYLYMLIYATC